MQTQQNLDRLVSGWRVQDLAARLAAIAGKARRLLSGRATLARIEEMEDWQLSDIGLTRADLQRVHEQTGLEDPTRLIDYLVRERRREISRRRP